uniref:Uncharacterized protein n=1 Tax=Panagrolaimus sp. PS1159 TaxID=55785 RepID=A0AC35GT76_9BILA
MSDGFLMLHAYEIIPFDNKNGGVWYQGFEITYDKEKIKQEEPLQVFVVPHSHNDPAVIAIILKNTVH